MVFKEIAIQVGWPVWAVVIVLVWSLIWKGLALWKSAKLSQPIWFVLILVINTAGILEILYIFLFSEIKLDGKKGKGKTKKKAKRKRKR